MNAQTLQAIEATKAAIKTGLIKGGQSEVITEEDLNDLSTTGDHKDIRIERV